MTSGGEALSLCCSDCLEVHARAAIRVDVATVQEMITESLPGNHLPILLLACRSTAIIENSMAARWELSSISSCDHQGQQQNMQCDLL